MFICFAFKNTGICSFLCISSLKNIGIYSIFCVFALLPQKTLKGKQCCNLQHFVNFEKLKIVRKMCQNGTFFPILGTLKTGGNALGDAYERPWFGPKSFPPAEWRIFGVFRGPASEGRRLGARLTIELYSRSGTLVGQATRGEPAEPN